MSKERCFALNAAGKCSALKTQESGCKTGRCPFYKGVTEQEKQAQAARKRCERLGIPYGEDYGKKAKGELV